MKWLVFVFVSTLLAVIIEVNGSIIPLTDNSDKVNGRVESDKLNTEDHSGHPHGRKERCFFSSPSASGSSSGGPNWQMVPRIQNVGTRQYPVVGGNSKSIFPPASYQFASYID